MTQQKPPEEGASMRRMPPLPPPLAIYSDAVLAALEALLPELERGGVTELDVAAGDTRIYLRRRPGALPSAAAPLAVAPDSSAPAPEEGLVAIKSPLSGVFYASPAPDEPPYVQEGDEVDAGQVVALVEAMKVFNEIHAEVPGTVVRINATAGQLVQAGATLMEIRPAAVAVEGEAV